MRITEVNVFKACPPKETWVFVAVSTDEGLTGWGEITGSTDDSCVAQLCTGIGEKLKGKDPTNLIECMTDYYKWQYPVVKTNKIVSCAWSGIDQALWDLTAQYYGLPLYKLLGGSGNNKIELYANLNRGLRFERSPEALKRAGEAARKSGFRVVKCTPFDEVNPHMDEVDLGKGFERYEALLSVVPVEDVALDCHQRFARHTLARMLDVITRKYGLPYWVEDPVDVADLDTINKISTKYPELRWAAGEDSLGYIDIFSLLNNPVYEVIMPDLKYIGGISVVKTLIPFIEGLGKKASLHNPNGPISTAHSAHVSAVSRYKMPLEFPWDSTCERVSSTTPTEPIENGFYVLNDLPGIGIKPAEAFLERFAKVWRNGAWQGLNSTI